MATDTKTRQTRTCTQCDKRKSVRIHFRFMADRNLYHTWCRDCEAEASKMRSLNRATRKSHDKKVR